jgi:chromosome partitioning protein
MPHPYVITISSEKGGVGKTTLATNLAIYLKGLQEDLPVTLFSFDNHFSVDKMFRIGRGDGSGGRDVSQLLTGEKQAEDLLEIGEFGVQFIPSHRELPYYRQQVAGVDLLAKALARSSMGGVVIVDTRPDMDIFTQNAIYAADQVIIPVKDAPSLENCRHIFDCAESHGLARKKIMILPCLLDARVRFDGPFKNLFELIRAYSINRGYRCFKGYIAKSPKVEALNTNPQGKIYPVITHGRGTEVHQQFSYLAACLLEEYQAMLPQQYRSARLRALLEQEQFAEWEAFRTELAETAP